MRATYLWCGYMIYRQTFSISRHIQTLKWFSSRLAVVFAQIHWSQVLSREWICRWSSADMRCSNYIWVINKFITYQDVADIRGLTVRDAESDVVTAYRALLVCKIGPRISQSLLHVTWIARTGLSHCSSLSLWLNMLPSIGTCPENLLSHSYWTRLE